MARLLGLGYPGGRRSTTWRPPVIRTPSFSPRGMSGPADDRYALLLRAQDGRRAVCGKPRLTGLPYRRHLPPDSRRQDVLTMSGTGRHCARRSPALLIAGEWRRTPGCESWPHSGRRSQTLRIPSPPAMHRQRGDDRGVRRAAGNAERRRRWLCPVTGILPVMQGQVR